MSEIAAAARQPAAAFSFDPQAAGFDPEFADPARRGCAVASDRLVPAALRARFAAAPAWTPELRGDERPAALRARPLRRAAVLVPLRALAQGTQVLFTRRAARLAVHAGQISFPGGSVEAGDRDPVHTALREAGEETGLPEAAVEVLGVLPAYLTRTGFEVTPVVGLVEPTFVPVPAAAEVDEVFEVPLAFLMDPAHHERRLVEVDGRARPFYAMPWQAAGRSYFIWGATAAMLRNLYQLLRA